MEKRTIKISHLSQLGWLILAIFVAGIISGCSKRPPPPPPPAAQAQKAQAAKDEEEEQAEEQKEKEVYFYTPIGKRDPFRPFYVDITAPDTDSLGPKPQGPTTLLEQYELEQLKLIAIITGLTTPRAMVEVPPDGKGYIVKPGTPIGKHGGRVAAIKRGSIIVEEEYIGTNGEHHVNKTIIELFKKSEGI